LISLWIFLFCFVSPSLWFSLCLILFIL
jgi:hypothetical protein